MYVIALRSESKWTHDFYGGSAGKYEGKWALDPLDATRFLDRAKAEAFLKDYSDHWATYLSRVVPLAELFKHEGSLGHNKVKLNDT